MYHVPDTLEQALGILSESPAQVVAGCTDFFPSKPPGRLDHALIDLTRINGLRGITRHKDGWRIGATTTWTDIVIADLPAAFDGLKQAAREVGSVQIQNTGTIAGNICNASPAADGVPALLTLDAEVEIASTKNLRRVPLADFILGVRKVDLEPNEIVTAIMIPEIPDDICAAFEKLGSRKYLVISIVMTSAMVRISGGKIDQARIAVGACSPVAQRQPKIERYLVGKPVSEIVVEETMLTGLSPIDDVRGDAIFRTEAVCEQVQRTILKACVR